MLDLHTADFWQERYTEMVREVEKNLTVQRSLAAREDDALRDSGRLRRLGEWARALHPVRSIRHWADT